MMMSEEPATGLGNQTSAWAHNSDKLESNTRYGDSVRDMDAVSAYPRDLAGIPVIRPLDRLRVEVETARAMYREVLAGDRVDYARLAGSMAGALDNIAFFMEWADTASH